MTFPKQLTDAQASPEPVVNANFGNLRPFAIGSERSDAHSGLVWGYWGGTYLGNTTADGTVTLTNSATNYLVILRSTGAVSVSTSTTNSLDPLYATLATIVVAGGLVTSYTDTRTGTNGLFSGAGGGGGGGGAYSTTLPVTINSTTSAAVLVDPAESGERLVLTGTGSKTVEYDTADGWAADDVHYVGNRASSGNVTLFGTGITLNAPKGGTLVLEPGDEVVISFRTATIADVAGSTEPL